ncbi:MAG: integration host factor subunit alpha [Deltaproteobacteria bacterium]|nr:integration host factor subunit alpha [Deltaproteobacteria bacterium]
MTLTKAELIDAVYEKVGFSKKEAADLVELVFETVKEELCKGGSIKISGFGKFRVRNKKARMGRNPQTGEAMEISARKVLTFTPSRILRDGINGKSAILPSAVTEDSTTDNDDQE